MAVAARTAYPSQYETEALLRDGSRILLRPIRQEDAQEWLAFVSRLNPHALYLRFHHVPGKFSMQNAVRYCAVDYSNTFAFVAEVIRKGRKDIVALARYYRLPSGHSAEVAVIMEDAFRGKGLGTKLMEWLANAARANGITSFEAEVLSENEEMMAVFRNYGFHLDSKLEDGVHHVTFPITRTWTVMRKEEERERVAAVASLRSIAMPHTVAVIGASRDRGSIGHLLMECLVQSRFSGILYPVNPHAEAVMSIKAYPTVLAVPGDVDMAVIAVPAPLVAGVADECGRKGVRSLVVISDGFKERGPEGAAREKELRDIALGYGMRLLGPNCMGVINTDPAVNLNATFSPVFPPPGNVAFLSQSGALGLAILEHARSLNLGISSFVSAGNAADISYTDLLQYWEQDRATEVILLYLESFGNPRKFARIARRVSAVKPIVAIKSGRTQAGSRAALSHTGQLATLEVASEGLFRQAGIARVDTMEELFGVAALLSNQPVPAGRRVVIVTNGGGPGILAADACEQQGLELPELSAETIAALRPAVRRDIQFRNPLDLTADATEAEFAGLLGTLAKDPGNDAVLSIFIPPTSADPTDVEDAIRRVAPIFRRHQKPLLVCYMGQRGFKARLGSGSRLVPAYQFPEDAVLALAAAAEYGDLRRRPKGHIPRLHGLQRRQARKVVERALRRSVDRPLWLSPQEIAQLLGCYGIPVPEAKVATTAGGAAAAASQLGFPVAVKLDSPSITHKTDVGGVLLNLTSEADVRDAFDTIRARLEALGRSGEMQGVIIQRMVKKGTEVIVGVTQDPSFGPLIMLGLGGTYAELFQEVAVRLHPLTDLDAREMMQHPRLARMLEGYRGAPPSDAPAVEDLLLRVSALIEDTPQVAEMDLNPAMVMPRGQGCWVVDARVLLK